MKAMISAAVTRSETTGLRARVGTSADLPWTRVRSLLRTGAGRTRPQLGEQVSDVFGDDAMLAGERGGLLASVPVLRSQLTEASFLALRYCVLCRLLLLCSACAGLAGGLTGRPKLCPRQVCCPAALRINRVISSGCEISERWLAFTSMVWAPIRLAMKRSRSGLMVRSSVETA